MSNFVRFNRPDGALTLGDIRPGIFFYEVNGTEYGNVDGTVNTKYKRVVKTNVMNYCESKSYPFKKTGDMADTKMFESEEVFTFEFSNETMNEFVNDLSLVETERYNNNFIFSDLKKAHAYAKVVQEYWKNNTPEPDYSDSYDDYDDYDYDYQYDEENDRTYDD